jgi:hypothetical protein
MNKGLEVLLARIESHPEEFIGKSSVVPRMTRWSTLVDIALDPARSGTFITPEEREALVAQLAVVRGEQFSKNVLQTLMDVDRDDSSEALEDAKTLPQFSAGVYRLSRKP